MGAFQCKALSVSAYSVINSAYTAEWNTKSGAESKVLTISPFVYFISVDLSGNQTMWLLSE